MRMLRDGYDGLSLVMVLNLDRMLFLMALIVALLLGSFLGAM